MMTRTNKNTSFCCVLLICFVMFQVESSAAEREDFPRICDRITLDSVDIGIRHDKIDGIARLRGRSGPIVYVNIVPPQRFDVTKKITKISLWWLAPPLTDTACHATVDHENKATLMCIRSIAETSLRLELSFKSKEEVHDAKILMRKLEKYVSDEVLCELK
jgi:hypothetical protein